MLISDVLSFLTPFTQIFLRYASPKREYLSFSYLFELKDENCSLCNKTCVVVDVEWVGGRECVQSVLTGRKNFLMKYVLFIFLIPLLKVTWHFKALDLEDHRPAGHVFL